LNHEATKARSDARCAIAMKRKHKPRFDRVAGMIGCLGGIIWIAFFMKWFVEAMSFR